ncbi:hypothetical protein GS429_11125 [Natronorubrum sp. JWXQ-INN-674]|uniref:Uncharacterized protein n=1 Tax=Natronorubrum halalkaliphilum TaxID=2691917 RepID=A0A6B0VNQ9_9EURY|nr:hypothetical protein [Natronorubrum halalkaliphilum]MXV62606.1 hypothetical protein [Natronorubrum halalkaliphilum]
MSDEVSTQDTMRERADESRLKLWLLLGANRTFVTVVLSVAFFALFVGVGSQLEPPLSELLEERGVIETLFSAMIGALITGVTLVVTISQLIISEENGPLGEQHRRMSEMMDFRDHVTDLVGKPSPADPSALLRSLIDATDSRAEGFQESTDSADDGELAAEVDEYVESLTGNADTVREQLDGAQFGTFEVLNAALDYNYSWKIFQLERLEDDYGDVMDDDHRAAIDELRTALVMFGPAREHVKTLYFQWELIDLSRLILYAAIPALLVAGIMFTFVDASTAPGTTAGIENVLWLVSIAFTITLVPFFLLSAYVIRIATAAKRTLAIGPLILRGSQR